MREAGQSEEAILSFASAYERLESGESAMLPTAELEAAGEIDTLEQLADADATDVLDRVAVIKLNGGLATSMGLRSPKSLVEARDGHSFLDIIVGQTLALRSRYGARLPLVLMNSEATREETMRALEAYPELGVGLPLDFLQSMVPKLDAETLEPITWASNPSLEWNPPGHGDVYSALRGSGMLDAMLDQGYRYAMISNADNLGSTTDARIPAHMERGDIPFLMEVVLGTEADRKGGHIARRTADKQLVLRETAQTPPEDEESFRDYRRWRYYNTNSLWVDLRALKETLDATGGVLELPLIVNRKTVDPRLELARGHSARERDGRGNRRREGRAAVARAANAIRSGQNHRRSAGAPLRRLHAFAAGHGRGADSRTQRRPSLRRARLEVLQAARRL